MTFLVFRPSGQFLFTFVFFVYFVVNVFCEVETWLRGPDQIELALAELKVSHRQVWNRGQPAAAW